MPGFFVSNRQVEAELINRYPERCIREEIHVPGMSFRRNTLNKFMQDKAFGENAHAVLIADGYLLNKQELFEQYRVNSVADLMWEMYLQQGETFFNAFRGAFSGALYDRKRDTWLVYTNHCGDAAVFISIWPDGFCAGTQVNYIIDAYRARDQRLSFDESAAYQMLTFGFMEGDNTYAREIKRLRGGTYLRVQGGEARVLEYHRFRKNPERFRGKTEDEIINALDEAFRSASMLEYRKDDEYGLEHLTDLSGGLDSRMNMWVAHAMSPRHMHLLTYCKANYLDEIIAKEIAQYWGDEITVKALDDASYLYEIDELVFMNGGLSLYSGITGGKRMLEDINMDRFGLEHTGMLGDIVIGSWYRHADDGLRGRPTGRYSERLAHRLSKDYCASFDDQEVYLHYTRGFQGAANSHLIRCNFTEVASTFMHVDLMQLCLDIPAPMRIGHSLYKRWIIEKYPDAARFRWEKTRGKITEPHWLCLVRHLAVHGPNKLKRMLGRHRHINTGMNPLDYWISHNDALRAHLDAYEREGYRFLPASVSETLIADMKNLYKTGNASEKTMVLTVLASARLYFGREDE